MQGDADEIVCLEVQEPFEAVGLAYDDFRAVTDETVQRIVGEFQGGADR